MKRAIVAIAFATLALFGLAGCSGTSESTITVAGSTTVLPIAEEASEQFTKLTGCNVLVSGLGSSAGIEAMLNGTADIATSSRDLTEEEAQNPQVKTTVIARDGIAVIANEANPVNNLTVEQLRDIYAGNITNWSEVGGPNLDILVVNRDEASGTREAFKSIVMQGTAFDRTATVLPGTGQVRDVVSRTKGAIGYISIGFVDSRFSPNKVKTFSIDGIEPTEQNIEDGTYPISRSLYFFTLGEPTGNVKSYIEYVLSPNMHDAIKDAGYLPVSAIEEASNLTEDVTQGEEVE